MEHINHPAHYNEHSSGIEAIDIAEYMSFNIGNAFKYVVRADFKDNKYQDLGKALWYLSRELNRHDRKRIIKNKIRDLCYRWRESSNEFHSEFMLGLLNEDIEQCIEVVLKERDKS